MTASDQKLITFCAEKDDIERVMHIVDTLAIKQKCSRSNIIRNALYDYFGIVPENPHIIQNHTSRIIKRSEN